MKTVYYIFVLLFVHSFLIGSSHRKWPRVQDPEHRGTERENLYSKYGISYMRLTNHPTNKVGVYYLTHPLKTSTLSVSQPVFLDNLPWHGMMVQ